MKGVCQLCKNIKNLSRKKMSICYKCYELFFLIKQKCDICHEYNYLKNKNINICIKCYAVLNSSKDTGNRPLRLCSKCGKIKKAAIRLENGYLCNDCYDPPKKICKKCGEKRYVYKYINKKPYCRKCCKPPKKVCSICKKENYIKINNNGYLICDKCYKYPQVICCRCGIKDRNYKTCYDGPICHRCYDEERYKDDINRIICLLRKRVRDAFNSYSFAGKIKKADEYGINYKEIINHLGLCPGNRSEYHIDHIFPLSAFNFNNPKHILAAFSPENHQWLKVTENLQKNAKYDKDKFVIYLNKFL